MLFVIASKYKLIVHPIDDKTAFLNGDLKYMKQPEGCVVSKKEHKVFKLGTSIYGLKQEPKKLNEKIDNMMLSHGYLINGVDKIAYIYRKLHNNEGVIIYLYVNDLLIFSSSHDVVHNTKCFLNSKFDVADLGKENIILEIKILRDNGCIIPSQSHYVEKIFKDALGQLCLLHKTQRCTRLNTVVIVFHKKNIDKSLVV